MTPEERAVRSADAMWARDAASRALGATLDAVGEGTARLSLTVEPRHCNGLGTCHGGVIFTLADSAFAFACNARNRLTVAQHAQVSFLAPARAGDRLVAEAREVHLAGRSGLYDVRVTGPDGPVAEFRGMSRAIPGHHFDEEET